MGEPAEQPTESEEETPVEAPEEPQEPTEAPGEGEMPPEGGEPSEEPETPPVGQTAAASDKEMGDAFKKLEKEATRHANRVSEIVGEAAQDLVVCELCEPMFAGFHWPVSPDEEQKERVRAAIGDAPAADLKPDTQARACDDCNGYGKVLTGSHVEGFDAMVCKTCNGAGAVGPRFEEKVPAPIAVAPAPDSNGPTPSPLSAEAQAAAALLRSQGVMVIEPTRVP